MLSEIHNRMPVVVPPDAFDLWLNWANVDEVTAVSLIVPAQEDLFEAYEVSTAVNRAANDDPKLIEPLTAPLEPRPARKSVMRPGVKRAKEDDGQGVLL